MSKSWNMEKKWMQIEKEKLYPPFIMVKPRGFQWLVRGIDIKDKKVLDHGCGSGLYGKKLVNQGARVTGIDISDYLLSEAKKYFSVYQQDVKRKLRFKSNSFDIVLSLMTMHILDKISLEAAVKEIARVLKPDGILLLGIVHPYAPKWDIKKRVCFYDFKTYTKSEKRVWLFNLFNNKIATASYYHHPLSVYMDIFSRYFTITTMYEPQLHTKNSRGKYAEVEYLFIKAKKIK